METIATNRNWIQLLSLPLAVLLLVGFVRLSTQQTTRNKGADSDGRQYVTMAGDTALFGKAFARYAPFCYRVATPWIASRLPGKDVFAKFQLLAIVDAVLMLLLVFALMRALKFSHWDAILGMVLYGTVFWALKFAFFSPCYIDHLAQVAMLLILVVMAKGWWPLLPILVFGGYFQKETVVALVPVYMIYFLWIKGWRWWPLYVLGFFSLAASVVPYFILRNNVHPTNLSLGSPFYAIADSWMIITTTPGYPRILIVAIFSGLGLLPVIALSHGKYAWRYLRAHPYWLVMILTGTLLLFGGKDKSRLFLHMLPAMTVLAVAVIRDLRKDMPKTPYFAWLGLVSLLHAFMGNLFTPFRDFFDYVNRMVPEHSPTEGGQGFTRVTLVVTLFLVGNYVLRKQPEGQFLKGQ